MHGYRPDECVRCADRAVIAELRAELAAAQALLRAYPGATYANSDLIQWEQLRRAALAATGEDK